MFHNPQKHDLRIIEEVSNSLNIRPAVVEKDLYVTNVLHALANCEDENFKLLFQGGTSLSKAYDMIKRMSEDCDFRIIEKNNQLTTVTKNTIKEKRKQFREKILECLSKTFLKVNDKATIAKNSSTYIEMELKYEPCFPKIIELRPDIKLEFIFLPTQIPPESKQIKNLVQKVAGKNIYWNNKKIECVNIVETSVEKYVALLRKAALMSRNHKHDRFIIRHLYDLYVLNKNKITLTEHLDLIHKVIERDQEQYKNKSEIFCKNPIKEFIIGLNELKTNKEWRGNWDGFMGGLVFDKQLPIYEEALLIIENVTAVLK